MSAPRKSTPADTANPVASAIATTQTTVLTVTRVATRERMPPLPQMSWRTNASTVATGESASAGRIAVATDEPFARPSDRSTTAPAGTCATSIAPMSVRSDSRRAPRARTKRVTVATTKKNCPPAKSALAIDRGTVER